MTTLKRITVIATMLVCAAISASADPYTFNELNGTWDNRFNWWPVTGPPGPDDDATIPNGKTCRIEDDNQSIDTLTINTGGLLQIKGKKLTIYSGATVNGDLEFHKPGATDPSVELANDITVGGAGTISASDGDGLDPGIITCAGVGLDKLTIDGTNDLTVKGSITFLTHLDLTNAAELLVDDDEDEMVIGYLTGSPPEMEIDGDLYTSYTVSAGTLKIGYTKNMSCLSEWDVAGGTLQLTQYASHSSWQEVGHLVKVSSGTLKCETTFLTDGGLEFSGGTIEVAAGKSVLFAKKP